MNRLARACLVTVVLIAALAAPGAANASSNDPIVFVHGYGGNSSGWDTFKSWLIADGYDSSDFAVVDYGITESNVGIAQKVKQASDQLRTSTGAAKVDIVTHSMGGLSSRYYVKNLGGASYVNQFVSIAGPNHGTTLALACTLFLEPCREMTPGGSFLKALNAVDETPGPVDYLTIRSICDEIVVPFTSTPLSGATNVSAGCKEHILMNRDADVYASVKSFIQ